MLPRQGRECDSKVTLLWREESTCSGAATVPLENGLSCLAMIEIEVTTSWRRYEWVPLFPAIFQNSLHSTGSLLFASYSNKILAND